MKLEGDLLRVLIAGTEHPAVLKGWFSWPSAQGLSLSGAREPVLEVGRAEDETHVFLMENMYIRPLSYLLACL